MATAPESPGGEDREPVFAANAVVALRVGAQPVRVETTTSDGDGLVVVEMIPRA